jgi:hypothetical protein
MKTYRTKKMLMRFKNCCVLKLAFTKVNISDADVNPIVTNINNDSAVNPTS